MEPRLNSRGNVLMFEKNDDVPMLQWSRG